MGLVDVDVGDVGGRAAGGDPALEEIEDELLIGGAEAEARRPPGRRVLHFRLFRRRGGEIGWWTCPWRLVCPVNSMLRLLKLYRWALRLMRLPCNFVLGSLGRNCTDYPQGLCHLVESPKLIDHINQ